MTQAMAIEDRMTLGAKLEDLITSRFLAARWTSRVGMEGDLPVALQRCVRRLAPDTAWRAYTDDTHFFFAIARCRDNTLQPGSGASMDVYFLDSDAAVFSAGAWVYDHAQGWWLDAVLPASYDSEHGWWLDAVMASPGNAGEDYIGPVVSNLAHSRGLTLTARVKVSPPAATASCAHNLPRRMIARRRRLLMS